MSTSSPTPQRLGTSTHASYHPGGYGVSEGLKRARRPFIVRNAITGTAIAAFATGVYWYSISKVKQDDFSDLGDVRVPQAPVQSTAAAAGVSERPVVASQDTAAASSSSSSSPQQVATRPTAALSGPATAKQDVVNKGRMV